MFQVLAGYPGDTAKGADYFSGASQGEVVEDRGNGDQVVRPERVLDTGAHVEFEGRICVGERTVRHWAALLGMVDGWRVEALMAQAQADVDDRDLLSRELAGAREEVENLISMQRDAPAEVYIGLDGERHASAEAALEASRRAVGKAPRVLTGVRPLSTEEAPAS